jgi:hypothetical protein
MDSCGGRPSGLSSPAEHPWSGDRFLGNGMSLAASGPFVRRRKARRGEHKVVSGAVPTLCRAATPNRPQALN